MSGKMSGETTYYQRNKEAILYRAKTIMKITKKYYESKQEINTENYLKKKNIKRERGRNRYHNV